MLKIWGRRESLYYSFKTTYLTFNCGGDYLPVIPVKPVIVILSLFHKNLHFFDQRFILFTNFRFFISFCCFKYTFMWKGELVRNEFGYWAEEFYEQSIEAVACFLAT